MKITEKNYLQQLKLHNEKALLYVVRQHGGLLKVIVRKHLYLLKDYEEECLNDVFMGIWNNIRYFEPDKSSFENWIAGIARYKSIDYLRKYYRQAVCENVDYLDIPMEDDMLEKLIEQELSDELEQMLGCLNSLDRELFMKLYVEEKDMDEVSQETGLKKEVIYNRVSRGKKRIQKRVL